MSLIENNTQVNNTDFGKIEKLTSGKAWETQGLSLMEECDWNMGTPRVKTLYPSSLNVKINDYRRNLTFTYAPEMSAIE